MLIFFFLPSFYIGRHFIPRPTVKRPDENHLHFNLVFYAPVGGVLPEKLGGGVRPSSQNPYPI